MSEELEKRDAERPFRRRGRPKKATEAEQRTAAEEKTGRSAETKDMGPERPKRSSVRSKRTGGTESTEGRRRKAAAEGEVRSDPVQERAKTETTKAYRTGESHGEPAQERAAEKTPETSVEIETLSEEKQRARRRSAGKALAAALEEEKRQGSESVPEEHAPEQGGIPMQETAQNPAARTEEGAVTQGHDPDSKSVHGILEVMQDGFGFIRSENFLPGEQDVYVNPQMIRRYGLRTGDMIQGFSKSRNPQERYGALMYIETLNGLPLFKASRRVSFEKLTPIFPNERLHLEVEGEKTPTALRVLDLLAPIGKGQRGMIVSPPKAGKTTLLKQIAKAIVRNEPEMHLLILLIDERPEEVTDMKEEVEGGRVQVIYSTFDETPENHRRVAEMTIERAKRLVEQGEDVTILLDSITRLARAYNLTVTASGRTLSGGLDPAALHPPKRFFGAARNMREHGSLTILATALVDTGSRMDDVIYEEFKGTGNMELVLNRELQERRIFPAIDVLKSGTRRDDLLLSELEQSASDIIHRELLNEDRKNSVEELLTLFDRTENNRELCEFLVNRKPISSGTVSGSSGKGGSKLLVKINRQS